MCNSGNCVNDASLCSQGFGASNVPTQYQTSGTANSSNPLSNTCTGNIRYVRADADACASLAVSQGTALGYTVVCTVERRDEWITEGGNVTGKKQDAFYGMCSVNGLSGFDSETLAGYTGSGNGYTVIDPTNNTQKQIFQAGTNRVQSWNIVPCDLANQASGVNGVTAGIGGNCVNGASNFFGSANPSGWRPQGTETWGTVKNRTSNITGTSNTGTNTTKTTTTVTTSAYNNAVLNTLRNIINAIKQSGIQTSSGTQSVDSAGIISVLQNMVNQFGGSSQ